jgi:rhomboid family GlyGly-CTERM serine protease
MRRLPWITLALAVLACLVQTSPALGAALEFSRTAVNTHGEVWRFLTAHLTHFGTDHLRWDVAALLILGVMAEHENRRGFAVTLLGSALAIGLGVWMGQPNFETYRGLSGVDSALYGLVCARLVRDGRRARHGFSIAVGVLALAGFALKCGAELTSGATVFANGGDAAGYSPVPLAHLIGLAAGIAGATWEHIKARRADGGASRPRPWGWPCPWRLS